MTARIRRLVQVRQAMRKLSRLLAYSANVPAGIVLVRLMLDPDRPRSRGCDDEDVQSSDHGHDAK